MTVDELLEEVGEIFERQPFGKNQMKRLEQIQEEISVLSNDEAEVIGFAEIVEQARIDPNVYNPEITI